MKKYVFVFLLCYSTAISATHIVGGQLYYDCLNNNNYRVTLKLYRDCDPSVTGQFDDTITIYIYNATGTLYTTISAAHTMPTRLAPPINPCLNPPNICVEEAIYTTTVNLPPRAGGYDLVYQRCCRNNTISNVIMQPGGPSGTIAPGSTYYTHVPGTETNVTCNNAVRFRNFPPIFICVNSPLSFDHSAVDTDGDSLVYSIVDPLDGATGTCPIPGLGGCPISPPPPYSSVPWLPGYSAANPLNNPSGNGDLTIDPNTGLLTAIPNQVGQFVMSIAVKEYRNGVLLNTTYRDFQFNVTTCSNPVGAIRYLPGTYLPSQGFGVYTLNCDNFTVNFQNGITYSNPPPTNIPLSYEWDFGVTTLTTDTSSLSYPTYTYPDTGTFKVRLVVKKRLGTTICSDTNYALVSIYPGLQAAFTKSDYCQDSAAIFIDRTVSPHGNVNAWTWSFGDGTFAYTQNPTHLYSNPGYYPVKLTTYNHKGCYSTVTDTVYIRAKPNADFTTSPLCLNDTSFFTNTSTPNSISNSYWDFGGGQTSTIRNPYVVFSTPGIKTVSLISVTNEGCRDTVTKTVTVNPLPVVTVSPNVTICPFTSTQLSASGGISYQWNNSTTLSSATIANPVAKPIFSPTIYRVTVTDANGCKNTNAITVTLHPIPNIDAGVDTSVCLNPGSFRDSVKLNATGGVSYVWTPANGLSSTTIANPTSRPAVNTTYFVTGTDTNGCKLTDSVTVFVLDPSLNLIAEDAKPICRFDTVTLTVLKQGYSFYQWSPPSGISNPFANSPSFFPTDTTLYVFYVENYCYQKRDTVSLHVRPLPNVSTQKLDSVCIGNSVQLNAFGADTFRWTYSPTLSDSSIRNPLAFPVTTTTYYVLGIDTFGCRNRDSVKVLVHLLPWTIVKPDTAFICQGQPVQLQALGGVDYRWRFDISLSDSLIANPIAMPLDTTTYYVRVFNIHQCYRDDTLTINVQLPVVADAQSPYDVCVGNVVQLQATGGLYYAWSPGTWLSSTTLPNPFAQPQISTNYVVTVSNDCFSDTATAVVTIRPLPLVDAGRDTTIWRNTEAMLIGTLNTDSFYWWPSQLVNTPREKSSLTAPLQTSLYYLFAVSEFGCKNKDSVMVFVEPKTILLLPTAFSPNGDGENDVFRVARHLNIRNMQSFEVFNRWGQKVFSTSDINEGWDGTWKGEPQPLATYVWYILATTYDGESVLKKGNVTLVR